MSERAIRQIRDAINTDACNGESDYARAVNAAVERHTEMVDRIAAEHSHAGHELEREAIAFYRGIPKWVRNDATRDFLRRIADHLGWDQLKGVL